MIIIQTLKADLGDVHCTLCNMPFSVDPIVRTHVDDLSAAKTSHDRSDCNGIVASEEQCMAGWTFRPVVKWQSGAGGSS